MSFRRSGPRPGRSGPARCGCCTACGSGGVVLPIGNPDVTITVDKDAVWENQDALTETFHELAGGIEFQDRGQIRHLPCGPVQARILTAPLCNPDRSSVFVDF